MHRVTARQHGRSVRPWVWTALAAAVAAAAALWVARPDPAACHTTPVLTRQLPPPNPPAPEPVPPLERLDPPRPGEARYYAFGPGVACSIPDLPPDGFYVGVPTEEYAGSAACGTVVELAGPLGTVRAHIVDRCPGCAPGQYDLSTAAFTRIADRAAGVAQIGVRRIRNPVPIPEVLYRVKDGSSADWLALLFADTGNPVSHVEIRSETGGPVRELTRGPDNYWSVSGAGAGPFTASVTDAEGHRADIPGIAVAPGAVGRTGTGMYRFPELSPAPAATPAIAPAPPVACT